TSVPGYKPVSMPVPAPDQVDYNPNSLWRAGAKAFFKDTRAKDVGDILTVKLDLNDSANWDNKTERDRDDTEDSDVTSLIGFEDELTKLLPQGADPATLVSFGSQHSTEGDGSIERSETLELTFAAVVTQVLPNGHLVLMGRQEVRVNAELRELMVTGVIRPEDVDSDNSIAHEDIAEMRVAYGGRGTLSDLQAPRWGTQIWDIIYPF
ncbi:MAG: flagellar basal body L-ring protein FlgH, partial [Rhodospirillales bacterium]|nr:flagellar basal body L-ring protein FlgH [Rhodospirillales bacterium]